MPLMTLILQESERLSREVAAWNKQCADKDDESEACRAKRYKLSSELGQHIASVNTELGFVQGAKTPDEELSIRRRILELELRSTLHLVRCLAVKPNPECTIESTAIESEKTAMQVELKQASEHWDAKHWKMIRISPLPKPSPSQSAK
jgi:hypothetical protein